MIDLYKRSAIALVFAADMVNSCFAGNPYSIEDAIYRIEIKDGNQLHTGTGVLIARDTILTNCHVVRHNGFLEL